MKYDKKWEAKEKLIDNEEPSRLRVTKDLTATLKEVCLSIF